MLFACSKPPIPPKKARVATTNQRVKEGSYIAQERALSVTEDLRTVVTPSPLGEPLGVKCPIYRNREMTR